MLQIILHRQWGLVGALHWETEIPRWEMCEMLRAGLPLLLLCSKCRILVRCAAVRYSPPHILSTLCSAISPTHIPSSTLSSVLRLCRIFSSVAQKFFVKCLCSVICSWYLKFHHVSNINTKCSFFSVQFSQQVKTHSKMLVQMNLSRIIFVWFWHNCLYCIIYSVYYNSE